MKLPSFAHLLGGTPRAGLLAMNDDEDKEAAAAADEAMEDEDEDAKAAESDDEAMDEDAADEAMEDEDDEARKATLAERRRCAAIFRAATPATVAQAATIAFTTDLSPRQAKALLAAAPVPAAAPRKPGLAAAMRGRNPAPLPASASDAANDDDASRLIALAKLRKKGN